MLRRRWEALVIGAADVGICSLLDPEGHQTELLIDMCEATLCARRMLAFGGNAFSVGGRTFVRELFLYCPALDGLLTSF